MKRFTESLILVVVTVTSICLFGGEAGASGHALLVGTGTGAGSGDFQLGRGGCAVGQTIDDGTFTGDFNTSTVVTPGDSGSYHIEACVIPQSTGLATDGTFALTTRVGTITGTFTSFTCGCGDPGVATMTVTNGTRGYSNAVGTITMTGVWTADALGHITETSTMTADVTR